MGFYAVRMEAAISNDIFVGPMESQKPLYNLILREIIPMNPPEHLGFLG